MRRLGRNFRRLRKDITNILSLYAPLTHSLVLTKGQGVATFTRATTATLTDFEGLCKTTKSGESRFEGARRVQNLTTENIGAYSSITMTVATGVLDPLGGNTAFTLTSSGGSGQQYKVLNLISGNTYTASCWIRRRTGTGAVSLMVTSYTSVTTALTSSWQRVSITSTAASAVGYMNFFMELNGDAIDVWYPQFEDVTGQANQDPSEYVSNGVLSAPYHGAGVDGVKYFTTQNGNTVTSKVVTEVTGSVIPETTLKGVQIEVASANLVKQSQALATSPWHTEQIVSTITVTNNVAVAPDGTTTATGIVMSAVTAGYADIYQASIATTAIPYMYSVWLKGAIGGEKVYIFSYQSPAASIVSTLATLTTSWQRFYLPFTGGTATSNIYIGNDLIAGAGQVATPAQTVYAWGVQLEALPMATSYTPTTTATVTRNADVLTFPNVGNVSNMAGTVLMDVTPAFVIPSGSTVGYGNNYLIDFGIDNGRLCTVVNLLRRNDGTTELNTPAFVPLKNTTYKIGSRYGAAGQRNWLNGTAGTNGAFDGSINPTTNMTIGGAGGGTTYNWGGTIKNLRIYKTALSDAQIVEEQRTYLVDEAGTQLFDELGKAIFYF